MDFGFCKCKFEGKQIGSVVVGKDYSRETWNWEFSVKERVVNSTLEDPNQSLECVGGQHITDPGKNHVGSRSCLEIRYWKFSDFACQFGVDQNFQDGNNLFIFDIRDNHRWSIGGLHKGRISYLRRNTNFLNIFRNLSHVFKVTYK